jgi:hypothetical protein
MRVPDLDGGSILNVIAELEHRLIGAAPAPTLHPELAGRIPEASTYVLVLFDGLGDAQLAHDRAAPLRDDRVGTVDAPFPTTTSVSLATLATGFPPSRHGLIGHLMRLPGHGVVNTLKWYGPGGLPADIDTGSFLPAANTWERLRAAGVEPITVQPGDFLDSPLSRALYRGLRYEPVWSVDDALDAVTTLAATARRLIFAYFPQVDFAAHLAGQRSAMYAEAMSLVASAWEQLRLRLPPDAVMVGISDHGHVDYTEDQKVVLGRKMAGGVDLFGDPRALYASGSADALARLGDRLPATWHDIAEVRQWWGSGPAHPELHRREPAGVFLAEPGAVLLPGHMDRRLTGYHGGLQVEEVQVPLLVAG